MPLTGDALLIARARSLLRRLDSLLAATEDAGRRESALDGLRRILEIGPRARFAAEVARQRERDHGVRLRNEFRRFYRAALPAVTRARKHFADYFEAGQIDPLEQHEIAAYLKAHQPMRWAASCLAVKLDPSEVRLLCRTPPTRWLPRKMARKLGLAEGTMNKLLFDPLHARRTYSSLRPVKEGALLQPWTP